jgi:PEP-CTERM motif
MSSITLPGVLTAGLAAWLMLSPTAATAVADVRGSAQSSRLSAPTVIVREPLVATLTTVDGPASIYGYADSVTGVLKATATAANVFGTPYASDVTASLIDGITFTSGFGKKAYLDYSFDGSFALAGYPSAHATFAQFAVFSGSTIKYVNISPYPTCGDACPPATSIDIKGTFEFTIQAAPTNIGASIEVYTSFGDTANFGNTAKLFLRTDESYTTTSGVFLSEAQPIFTTAVPEPESYVLMLLGLGSVALAARRRQLTRVDAEDRT